MAEDYPHFRTSAELRAGVLLWQIVSPVLILFGTFGNITSVIVLSRPHFRRWASTVYLIGLAFADLSMLYIGLLRQWVKYTFGMDIRYASSFTCKVHWWLMYVAADCSVWILAAITTERLVSTLCPYKSKKVCSKNTAVITLIFIVVCSLAINSHLLYGFDRLEINVENITIIIPCAPINDSYDHFFGKVWTWIDTCKFSLVPFAILTSGNACIIYRLISSRRKVTANSTSLQRTSSRKDMTSNMSLLLVALNCVFIVCTLPVCIYFIGAPYWIPRNIPRNVQLQDPWWAVVNLLLYINNTSNFILYCVTGSRFRGALMNLIRFNRRVGVHIPNSAVATMNTAAM